MVTIHYGDNNPLLIYPKVMNLCQYTPSLVSICFLGVDLGQITVSGVDCQINWTKWVRLNDKWGRLNTSTCSRYNIMPYRDRL